MVSFGNVLDVYSAELGVQIADEPRVVDEKNVENTGDFTQPPLSGLRKLQEERLAASTVNPGDRSITRTAKLLGRHVFTAAQDFAATAISAAAVGYVSAAIGSGDKGNIQGHIAHAVTESLAAATKAFVRSSVAAIVDGSRHDELSAQRQTYENLKTKITPEFLLRYPADVQDDVKKIKQRMEREIKANNLSPVFFEQRTRHLRLLLSRPIEAMDLTQGDDAVKIQALMDEISELCVYMEDPEALETLAMSIIMNSVAENPTRIQAYFQGPGGVGKSWIIGEIARILGVPFVHLHVEQKEGESGIPKLLGVTGSVDNYMWAEPDEKIIGELPLKMIGAACVNPIIFIDEFRVNRASISDLNLLLDPLKKKLKIGGYASNLDWSRATIIIGSNDKLTSEALQTRVLMMHISKAKDTVKHLVITRMMESVVKTDSRLLSKKKTKLFRDTIFGKRDELICLDNKKFSGARYIQEVARQTTHYVASGLLKGRLRTSEEITQFMQKSYSEFANFEASPEGKASDKG